MLLYWLNNKVVNFPYMANALDKLDKLAKRDSLPVATISDYYCEGVVAYRVRTEYNLG
jgi:hypothetical protein